MESVLRINKAMRSVGIFIASEYLYRQYAMMNKPIRIELPTVFETKTVNTYLFKEPEPILVDCGEKTTACFDALKAGLKEHRVSLSDISKIIITHAHLDHVGLAKTITEHSDAVVWVPEYGREWALNLRKMLERRTRAFFQVYEPNIQEPNAFGQHIFDHETLSPYWDEIPEERLRTFPMEGHLQLGGEDWEIIYAPGHCINQVCFYHLGSKSLLSADMLLKMVAIPIIDAGLEAPYDSVKSMPMLIESYKQLAKLEIEQVYPGHYAPFEDGNALISQQLAKLEMRKEKCFEFIQSGTHDFLELLHLSYPGRVNVATFFMLVGFLDILQAEGRIEAKKINGKLAYFVVSKTLQHASFKR